MKYLFTFSLLLSFYSQAQVIDMNKYLNPDISEGQCYSQADSKIYLKDIKAGTAGQNAISEIGVEKLKSLNNTDTESYFFCKVKCRLNNNQHTFWNMQKDKNENFQNLQGFVCHGLEISDVDLSPTLSIKTTIAKPFEAANSSYSDVRNYLKSLSYKLPLTLQREYINRFKSNVNLVSSAYINSQNAELAAAGRYLSTLNFSNEEESKKLIQEKVKELSAINWYKTYEFVDFFKKDNLVNRFMIDNGKFFEFVEF